MTMPTDDLVEEILYHVAYVLALIIGYLTVTFGRKK